YRRLLVPVGRALPLQGRPGGDRRPGAEAGPGSGVLVTVTAIQESAAHRRATIVESLIPLAALFLLLGVGSGFLAFRMEPMLLLAGAAAAVIARRLGYSWMDMARGISTTLGKAM